MTLDQLTSLLLFTFVLAITPGPNNLMLLACGASFGFRRSIQAIFGVCLGATAMTIIMGAGLIQALNHLPGFELTLKIVCMLYLLYLVYKIASAAAPGTQSTNGSPVSFLHGAAFQWVNPKTWVIATSLITLYAPTHSMDMIAVIAVIYAVVHLPCLVFWVVLGREVRRIITGKTQLRIFNGAMAVTLFASVAPMLFTMTGDIEGLNFGSWIRDISKSVPQSFESVQLFLTSLETIWDTELYRTVAR